jgi:Ser/Thr protein kinase RdoA (MazF antagonist)
MCVLLTLLEQVSGLLDFEFAAQDWRAMEVAVW